MRAALSGLLLLSTALVSGCVEGGYADSGVRYESDGGYYVRRDGFVRESRYDVYRARDRDQRYDRYDRYGRGNRYDRDDRGDRDRGDRDRNDRDRPERDRPDRDRPDRDRNDRNDRPDVDRRRALDAVNGQRNRQELRNGVCDYPCVR